MQTGLYGKGTLVGGYKDSNIGWTWNVRLDRGWQGNETISLVESAFEALSAIDQLADLSQSKEVEQEGKEHVDGEE